MGDGIGLQSHGRRSALQLADGGSVGMPNSTGGHHSKTQCGDIQNDGKAHTPAPTLMKLRQERGKRWWCGAIDATIRYTGFRKMAGLDRRILVT